jgi:glucuronate isomerase
MPEYLNSRFMTDDFLLESESARTLYRAYAESAPLYDFHSHLSPRDIAEDARFANLAQVWLAHDHYAWRAMRANGIDERWITGDAPDREKFLKWAETIPRLLGSPLYHWVHLELKLFFGIEDRLLNPDTAESIWEECGERLGEAGYSCRGLLEKRNARLVCTTDDPCDSLEYHRSLAGQSGCSIRVLPTFRPDRGLALDSPQRFNERVDRLASVARIDIRDFDSYLAALRKRHDYFHESGCRAADHGLDRVYAEEFSRSEIHRAFDAIRSGKELSPLAAAQLKSALIDELAGMHSEKGWVQQFHIGPIRNTNSRLFNLLGADAGCDSIGNSIDALALAKFLDRLDRNDCLAKTILYNNNPRDNEMIVSMTGNFQRSIPGKIQFGPAWWFLDQKHGIESHLEALSSIGLLGRFVGMTTDSRSFLSLSRHDYFRRVLCNRLGGDMERGLLPRDFDLVGNLVRDVCYRNAVEYFGFESVEKGSQIGNI